MTNHVAFVFKLSVPSEFVGVLNDGCVRSAALKVRKVIESDASQTFPQTIEKGLRFGFGFVHSICQHSNEASQPQ